MSIDVARLKALIEQEPGLPYRELGARLARLERRPVPYLPGSIGRALADERKRTINQGAG